MLSTAAGVTRSLIYQQLVWISGAVFQIIYSLSDLKSCFLKVQHHRGCSCYSCLHPWRRRHDVKTEVSLCTRPFTFMDVYANHCNFFLIVVVAMFIFYNAFFLQAASDKPHHYCTNSLSGQNISVNGLSQSDHFVPTGLNTLQSRGFQLAVSFSQSQFSIMKLL